MKKDADRSSYTAEEVRALQRRVAELDKAERLCTAMEGRLEESAARLSLVIEKVDEGITFSDSRGHFDIFNSKMQDITGYTMEEANACSNFMELLYPESGERQRAIEGIDKVLKAGSSGEEERVIQAKDGTRKTLLVVTSLVQFKDRQMFLSVYHDISKRKEIEALKTEFVSIASHELRTPLSIIRLGASVIKSEAVGSLNEKQKEVLTDVENNVDRLSHLLDDLLDISKIETGMVRIKKETIDMTELIKNAVLPFKLKADMKNLELRLRIPKDKINISADRDKIAEVIVNIVSNAIKFTKEGHVEIALYENPGEIECSVSDTGVGIAEENVSKAFEKFQQLGRGPVPGEKGSGLGLAIAKSYVLLHSGRIWMDSKIGKGTKVSFTLPK